MIQENLLQFQLLSDSLKQLFVWVNLLQRWGCKLYLFDEKLMSLIIHHYDQSFASAGVCYSVEKSYCSIVYFKNYVMWLLIVWSQWNISLKNASYNHLNICAKCPYELRASVATEEHVKEAFRLFEVSTMDAARSGINEHLNLSPEIANEIKVESRG